MKATPDKTAILKRLEVFRSLNEQELGAVARNSAWLELGKGQTVPAAAGERPVGRIHIIARGRVLITRKAPDQRDIGVATFVKGESFGELSLFDPATDDTTARCEEDTMLLLFPAAHPSPKHAADTAGALLFPDHPRIEAKILHNLLATVARRIRAANRLVAEKTPWVQELRRQVMMDKLTGLYNAGYLEEQFLQLVERSPAGLCLLMVKPDNLKELNDRYGHQAGDRVLQLMADVLHAQPGGGRPGAGATAVRYRGDVFAVILPEGGLEQGRRHAEKLRRAMRRLDVSEVSRRGGGPGERLGITVSIGVAAWPRGGRRAPELIERAYQNLFIARNRGGDRICGRQA